MCFGPSVALLLVLAVTDGLGLGDTTQILRCRCIIKEKKPIGRYIGSVMVYPANSHCSELEIIATLKKNGQKICLDPEARWLRRILRRNQPWQIPLGANHTRPSTV